MGADEDPERAQRSVRVIRREAGRMRNLVESLLALTRGDEGATSRSGATTWPPSRKRRRRLPGPPRKGRFPSSTSPRARIEATFDRGRVLQAAAILLDNAVKYTPRGREASTVRLGEEDGRVALEVSDTGIGIPETSCP